VTVVVRPARDDELDAAGDAVASAYAANPGMADEADYLAYVHDARARAGASLVLVAVDEAGAILGSVSYVAGPESDLADIATDGEAEFRMLGVRPEARGRGVGRALVEACVARARETGRSALVLSTPPAWTVGQRLYVGLGFRRAPDRDFDPGEDLHLWAYVLAL
jgi:ribosomal protein S18 acetylase RimI-like enzyme